MIDVQAHVEAFAAAMAAAGVRLYDSGAGQKFDGSYETPVFPYAVAYFDAGLRSGVSVGNLQDERAEIDAEIYYVAKNPRSCRAIRSKGQSLIGAELAVDGRVVTVRSVFSDRVKPNQEDPRQALFEGRDGVTVDSLKA